MGRRLLHPSDKKARGTDQPCRAVEMVVVPIEGKPDVPESINTERKQALWDKKVRDLMHRGIHLRGCEETLALYVGLLIDLDDLMKFGKHTQAQVAQVRGMAAEFFDTPASQFGRTASKPRDGNPFSKHGKPAK